MPFLNPPNDLYAARSPRADLHLFQENRKVKWVGKCPFNSGWLACWGRDIPKRFSNASVVCSGSTLGSKHGVTLYVNEMLKEMVRVVFEDKTAAPAPPDRTGSCAIP